MAGKRIDRRQFLAASAGGAALALAGCGGGGLGASSLFGVSTAPLPAYLLSDTVRSVDLEGNVYEIDPTAHSVTRVAPDGTRTWTTAPNSLNYPTAAAVDSAGRVCVANCGDHTLQVYDGDGEPLAEIGAWGSGAGEFRSLRDVVVDDDDRLYAADTLNHRVQVFSVDGTPITAFGRLGSEPGELNAPKALAFDGAGDLHVLDSGNARVQVFDRQGSWLRTYGSYGRGEGQLLIPTDMTIDAYDRCYVADIGKGCIQVFEAAGRIPGGCLEPREEGGLPVQPTRINLGPEGTLLITAA